MTLQFKDYNLNNNGGQSLLEIIVAIAIFSLIGASMVSLAVGGYVGLIQGGQHTEAEALAQEGIEAVRSIRDNAWNEMTYGTSSVVISNDHWIFSGEDTTETIGIYTRTISFSDVCRDASDNIVDCPGTYIDIHSKKVMVTVVWEVRPGVTNDVQKIAYITNWDSGDWAQTDWSGGSGQSQWSDITRYNSDNGNINVNTAGQVTLTGAGGGCGAKIWAFTVPANYSYDSQKIEVTGGAAQLAGDEAVCSGTPGACAVFGDQTNCENQNGCSWDPADCFGSCADCATFGGQTNCDNQGGCSWAPTTCSEISAPSSCWGYSQSQCEACPSCSWFSFWIFKFCFPSGGGSCPDLNQGMCTNCNDCSWNTSSCSGVCTSCDVYGSEPACAGQAGCSWDPADCFGTAATCGSFSDQPNCQAQQGCSWSVDTYPTDNPTIEPSTSYAVSGIDSWFSFSETAVKNGGEIYYQLSYDDGSSWQYWNGGLWITANAGNYNTASVVNANISSFATTSAQIMFKAFLESDGTQLVQLDEIVIGWSEFLGGCEGGYAVSGALVSSAFNMSDISPVQIIEWDETIPPCSPVCEIKMQVRTAPDSSGSPGTWTNWYGAMGDGTYFTDSIGTLIPAELNWNQWAQYRVELIGDGADTPVLEEVRLNYK